MMFKDIALLTVLAVIMTVVINGQVTKYSDREGIVSSKTRAHKQCTRAKSMVVPHWQAHPRRETGDKQSYLFAPRPRGDR